MFKKNSKNTTYLYLLFILLTVFIIIFLLFYYKSYEYYDSSSQPISGTFTLSGQSNNTIYRNNLDEESNDNEIYYQKGIGSPSHSGTINFTKPFSENPFVFTQVNGAPDSEDNVYSVTVSNITPNSFDYYKNVVSNNLVPAEEDQGEPMVAMKLSHDDNTLFNWIAFQ
jgi:hypothetical protein